MNNTCVLFDLTTPLARCYHSLWADRREEVALVSLHNQLIIAPDQRDNLPLSCASVDDEIIIVPIKATHKRLRRPLLFLFDGFSNVQSSKCLSSIQKFPVRLKSLVIDNSLPVTLTARTRYGCSYILCFLLLFFQNNHQFFKSWPMLLLSTSLTRPLLL